MVQATIVAAHDATAATAAAAAAVSVSGVPDVAADATAAAAGDLHRLRSVGRCTYMQELMRQH